MQCSDIPNTPEFTRRSFSRAHLLKRVRRTDRATWEDISACPGIYVVCWTLDEHPVFNADAGLARHADLIDPVLLQDKWRRICRHISTDIIYIGKGENLRKRIRSLVRFGVGWRPITTVVSGCGRSLGSRPANSWFSRVLQAKRLVLKIPSSSDFTRSTRNCLLPIDEVP